MFRAERGFPRRVWSHSRQDITPVFGFFALLRKAMRECGYPVEAVVCFDSQTSWAGRLSVFAGYKGGVGARNDDSPHSAWLPKVYEGLDALNLAWVEAAGVEADDVIASVVRRTRRDVLVMSSDRDFYQLVDERVRVVNTLLSRERWIIDADAIYARYRVRPAQWCDFRALTGDASDRIPGVCGVGLKRAAAYLDGIPLAALPESGRLRGVFGRRVLESWDDVLRWRGLLELRSVRSHAWGEASRAAESGVAASCGDLRVPRALGVNGRGALWRALFVSGWPRGERGGCCGFGLRAGPYNSALQQTAIGRSVPPSST